MSVYWQNDVWIPFFPFRSLDGPLLGSCARLLATIWVENCIIAVSTLVSIPKDRLEITRLLFLILLINHFLALVFQSYWQSSSDYWRIFFPTSKNYRVTSPCSFQSLTHYINISIFIFIIWKSGTKNKFSARIIFDILGRFSRLFQNEYLFP